MPYFISFLAALLMFLSPAARAAEDPSLDTLFGFTNQPPKSGEQPQNQDQPQNQKAPAAASEASPQAPLTASQGKPEPLFGIPPQKTEPTAPQAPERPIVKTPEPKTAAPVRVLPSQLMESDIPAEPKQEKATQNPVMAQPNILSAPAEVKTPEAPKAPEVVQPTPAPALIKKEAPAAPVMMPVVTPEPIKAEAPAHSQVKKALKPKAKAKPSVKKRSAYHKKRIQKKEPPKMVMSDEERRQKTRQMLEKSYDALSMALRIDFPAFSSALPRQSKVDLQDRLSALKPEETVVLYGSASIGPKGTPNAARAVAQSRMDRLASFMESLGVRADRIVTIDRSFTRQDSVDMAFVTVKTKREVNP
jgi:hypothetical protein